MNAARRSYVSNILESTDTSYLHHDVYLKDWRPPGSMWVLGMLDRFSNHSLDPDTAAPAHDTPQVLTAYVIGVSRGTKVCDPRERRSRSSLVYPLTWYGFREWFELCTVKVLTY